MEIKKKNQEDAMSWKARKVRKCFKKEVANRGAHCRWLKNTRINVSAELRA